MRSKNIHPFKTYILGCIGILLLASCAQVVSPGGGAKDTTPPRVIQYIPDSASLNFKARSIALFFDEYIQLQDLNNQLIISPPMNKTPEIKVKNKTVLIDFDKDEVLKPNTTYCFSFGNAIQDNNEGNPKENFKYIFSTGTFIDSLIVRGKVENAFNHKTEKGILVMLYSDLSDSVIYNKLPDYFAKTKEDGSFQINNIRTGKYKAYALKDANANYKYDGESESIGFVDTLIDASAKQNILIELFQEPAKKLFLKKYMYYSYGKITFIFNKSADSIRINPINHTFNNNDVILDYSTNRDSLTYWIKNYDKDSLILQVNNGNIVLDTIELKMLKKEDALKSNRNPLRLSLLNSPNGNQGFDLNVGIKLYVSNPLGNWKQEQELIFTEDSVPYKIISPLMLRYSPSNRSQLRLGYWGCNKEMEDPNNAGVIILSEECFFSPKLKPNSKYHLFIPPGTFTDIFGLTNDTLKIDFKTREEKYYGTVKLKINLPTVKDSSKLNYIVQLLDDKESLVRESSISNGEIINYEYLYPQKYKLKIIVDENLNGKWDSGDLLKKQQPEKVIYYSELITIRSNWDMDLEWKVAE